MEYQPTCNTSAFHQTSRQYLPLPIRQIDRAFRNFLRCKSKDDLESHDFPILHFTDMASGETSLRLFGIHVAQYAIVAVLLLGGLYYAWTTLPSTAPSRTAREAEALALVQNYPAIGFPSIVDAMNEHVRTMKERGQGVRLGEWRVKQVEGHIYEIRVQLRDQSVRGQWFEREFIWHAHLDLKKVNAASLPADGVTPKPPDSDPQPAAPFLRP
jgi:hypothetical protein